MTRSEILCVLGAARARRRWERDMTIFAAWRTATLVRAKAIPELDRLLRVPKPMTAAQRAQIAAEVAEADAAFAREAAASRLNAGLATAHG